MPCFIYIHKPINDRSNIVKMGVANNIKDRLNGINRVGYAGVLKWENTWSIEVENKDVALAVESLISSRLNSFSRGKVPNLIATKKGIDKFGWGVETYDIDFDLLVKNIERAVVYINDFEWNG